MHDCGTKKKLWRVLNGCLYVPGLQVYIASSQPDCYFPPSGPIERPGYSRDEGVMYN